MLTNREKRLLYLLAVVAVIMVTGIFFYFRYSELLSVEDQITKITKQIQKIMTKTPAEESINASIAELQKEIAAEKERFYKPGEIDLTTFSSLVREMITDNGLSVTRLRRETKPTVRYVEFILEGSAYNLSQFLLAVSMYEKYWTITDLTADNKSKDGKKMSITIRINYEVYSTDSN